MHPLTVSILAFIFHAGAMNNDSIPYKVISTRECIDYIEKSGMTIHDDSTFSHQLKSKSGLVYILPNKKIVLIPTIFDLYYPGIIFDNLEIFEHYRSLDYFPIGEEYMTWFEQYNKEIKLFPSQHDFYSRIITQALTVPLPFTRVEDVRAAFLQVQAIIGSNNYRDWSKKQYDLVCSFGMAVTAYLIEKDGYEFEFRNGHENYNPTTNIIVEKDGEKTEPIDSCFIYLSNSTPNSLNGFMHSIGLFRR